MYYFNKLDCNVNNVIQTPPSQSSDDENEDYEMQSPVGRVFSDDDKYAIQRATSPSVRAIERQNSMVKAPG